MTEIYLHIDARMADYIRTHPYLSSARISRAPSVHWTGGTPVLPSEHTGLDKTAQLRAFGPTENVLCVCWAVGGADVGRAKVVVDGVRVHDEDDRCVCPDGARARLERTGAADHGDLRRRDGGVGAGHPDSRVDEMVAVESGDVHPLRAVRANDYPRGGEGRARLYGAGTTETVETNMHD